MFNRFFTLFILSVFLLAISVKSLADTPAQDLAEAANLYRQAVKEINAAYGGKGSYEQAKEKLEKARVIYRKNKVSDERLADVLLELAVIYDVRSDFKHAIDYYLTAAQIRERLQRIDDKNFAYIHVYLGNIYNTLGKADSAEHYYKRGEKYVLRLKEQNIDLTYLYNSWAMFHYHAGNCKACLNYTEKSIKSISRKDANFTKAAQYIYSISAAALVRCGQYRKGLEQYRQLLKTHPDRNAILMKIGNCYLETNQPDSALVYMRQVGSGMDTASRIKYLNQMGRIQTGLSQYAQALDHFNQAITLNNQAFGGKNINLANAHTGTAQVHEAQNRLPQALASYQTAIQTLHLSFDAADVRQNPADVSNVVSRLDMFKALRYKADALQKQYVSKTQNPTQRQDALSYLQAALQTYQLAIRLAENLRMSYDSDETKLFFSQQVFPVYERAVSVAFLLAEKTSDQTYTEQAFILSEKSKAAVLFETLRGLQINRQKGVPLDLIRQERDLRRNITRLTVSSIEAKDPIQLVSLRDQTRDHEIALSQLIRRLDANDKYYQLKYNVQPVSIAKIQQKLLDKNTALIEYFFGEKELFAFVLTQHGFAGFRLSNLSSQRHEDTVVRHTLDKYKASIYEHHFSPEQPAWANVLYRKLVEPLKTALAGKEKLIIIPDGELNYLPFEALVTDADREKYLLEDYIVRYGYSGTLLSLAQAGGKANDEILAMAPFAGKSGNAFRGLQIGALPASKNEVEQVGGRIYLESEATKEVFLKTASRYGIVHLATHAKADSKEPLNSYITFYPQRADSITGYRLYTSELYNLQLDSVRLVVLSACETGGGQLVRGEGVMSLARAFAYAGCPNIVMTLWRAEDQATAQITTRMYEHLRQGTPKAEALHKAKLDYLRQAPATRHNPYFWANLVLVGDDEPVYPSRSVFWLFGVAAVFLAALVAVWLWRRQKRQTL